jgi:serine/threonine protein phosphatase PrpC
MGLEAAVSSDVGQQRKANEDCYAVAAEHGLYVVADGMGGHAAGQLASELCCRAMVRAIEVSHSAGGSLTERLRTAVTHANHEIFSTARDREELTGMGTTVVAALVCGDRAALAHVGDSRAYRLRSGRLRQLTDDHSLVGELLRRNEISPDAAREHPHRHVLTRALGVRPKVEPDLAEVGILPGDIYCLCSDGLITHVHDDEIAKTLAIEDATLQERCDRLVEQANQRGGEDNITVVLLRVTE